MLKLDKCVLYPIVCVESGSWSMLCRTWRRQHDRLHFFSVDMPSFLLIKQLYPSETDSENTSLLENYSNISLLPSPPPFCWGFAASFSLLRALERTTLKLRCWKLNTVEPLWTVAVARSHVVFTSTVVFFSSLIDGCLKYTNKEKPNRPKFFLGDIRNSWGRSGRAGSNAGLQDIPS